MEEDGEDGNQVRIGGCTVPTAVKMKKMARIGSRSG
jgi:hypothetical protein